MSLYKCHCGHEVSKVVDHGTVRTEALLGTTNVILPFLPSTTDLLITGPHCDFTTQLTSFLFRNPCLRVTTLLVNDHSHGMTWHGQRIYTAVNKIQNPDMHRPGST